MPLFMINCVDKANSLALRMSVRETHLAYVGRPDCPIKVAGPILDGNGDMMGSLFIVECEDLAAAQAFNAADPYTKAELFQSVTIRPFRLTIGKL